MTHVGTTMGDLSDTERVKDAEHELRRATTDAALADWARRWGGAAIERCQTTSGMDAFDEEEVKRLEQDLDAADATLAAITNAAEILIKVCNDIPDHTPAFDNAIVGLENSL